MTTLHWVYLLLLVYCLGLSSFNTSSHMELLRVGSLNMNGGRDRGKQAMLYEIIRLRKTNVIFLQETHSTRDDEVDWGLWWEGDYYLSHGSNTSAGVAVLFSRSLQGVVLSTVEIVKGRALLIKAEIKGIIFAFVNVYAPNRGSERFEFFGVLHNALLSYVEAGVCITMGGDWNCTTQFVIDRNGEEPHWRSSEKLASLISDCDMIDVWRHKNEGVRQYTWLKVGESRVCGARLDRFYVSRGFYNRVVRTGVFPVGFSDHHMVTVETSVTSMTPAHYYWHFNVRLLQDSVFCGNFSLFWDKWRVQKHSFESLSQWWDVGKAQIRAFCQSYSAHAASSVRLAVKKLQRDIEDLEKRIDGNSGEGLQGVLAVKRQELGSYLQEQVKGALIRARISSIKDVDAPSSYFFNLERKAAQQKQMFFLRRGDGTLTSDPAEMRSLAVRYYAELYGAEECDGDSAADLLQGLPQLSPGQREELDSDIAFEELTAAVKQLSTGRSPGVDGLPAEFYQRFWTVLGRDFYDVVLECLQTGILPTSCRRAVLSLLPKKGDLGFLKNWRPVSLLCLDYKILSKCMANRLKCYLDTVIFRDQTYCVPERTIMDNLFLVRDVIDFGLMNNDRLGILSIDQEKAFDRVDHGYLFNTLAAFGCGDKFVGWLRLLYNEAAVMVKVGGALSVKVPVQRGIRQGCPLSGQLYSLVIEPLLCRLRRDLRGVPTTGDPSGTRVSLSAYADDVTVLVTAQEDVEVLESSLEVYEKASSAKVNWGKCEGFLMGSWAGMGVPRLPGGLTWGREGLKVLGVFLGSTAFQQRNWEGMLDKVSARLSKWSWLLPRLSYRGRVLVVNNLAASMLWHRMMVLEPPGELIREIQRKMVAFFWSGQHWIRAAVLFLPVAEGGQGLVDIQSRVKAFRLQSVKRLLYQRDLPWTQLAGGILHRAGGLGYDLQLFWIRLAEVSLSGLTPFYRSLLQVWKTVFEVSRGAGLSGAWIREEPLLYNPLLQTRLLSSSSIRACLLRSGCTKLGHVLQTNGWRSPTELRKVTGLYSPRLVTQLLEEVESVLPGCYRELVVRGGTLDRQAAGAPAPNLTVRLAVQLDPEEETVPGTLFHIPALGRFQEVPKDALYLACVKVAHQAVLKRQRLSHWPGLFRPDFPLRDRWRSLYKPPIEKRSGDLQWRIIHGAIATDRHVAHLNPAVVGQCRFCGQDESVEHLFLRCDRLGGLFLFLKSCFDAFHEEFSNRVFIAGVRYRVKVRKRVSLLNYVTGTAKLAIWKTRKNRAAGVGCVDPEVMLRYLMAGRIKVEHEYYRLVNRMEDFIPVWGQGGVLCRVDNDHQLVLQF